MSAEPNAGRTPKAGQEPVHRVLDAMSCVSLAQVALLEESCVTGDAIVSLGVHLAPAVDEGQASTGAQSAPTAFLHP